jgi:hypothetical protein
MNGNIPLRKFLWSIEYRVKTDVKLPIINGNCYMETER